MMPFTQIAVSSDGSWIGVCRATLALLALVVFCRSVLVSLSFYPPGVSRYAAIMVRFALIGRSIFYWALILQQSPSTASTSGYLTWWLLFGYGAEFVFMVALGFFAQRSPHRINELTDLKREVGQKIGGTA
jgi:hypothetical protein